MAKASKKQINKEKKCNQNGSGANGTTKRSAKNNKPTSTPKKELKKSNIIEKSKQLLLKASIASKEAKQSKCKNNEQKTCSNGRPTPSLADLEKMFDESDDESEVSKPGQTDRTLTTTNSAQVNDTVIDLTSTTNICNDLLDLVSNGFAKTDSTITEETKNCSTSIPQKESSKRIHSSISSICIDCDSDCSDSIDSTPTKKLKIQNDTIPNNYSISEENDVNHNKVLNSSTLLHKAEILTSGRFSPLPSTSRDNNTIYQNERNFNASFATLDDELQNNENTKNFENTHVDNQLIQPIIINDDEVIQPSHKIITSSNTAKMQNEINETQSPIIIDDEYSPTISNINENIDVCDLIIEDVIAENNTILNKRSLDNSLGAVTEVSPTQTESSNLTNLCNDQDQGITNIEPNIETISLLDDYPPPVSTTIGNTNNNIVIIDASCSQKCITSSKSSCRCCYIHNTMNTLTFQSNAKEMVFKIHRNNVSHSNTTSRNANENNRFRQVQTNNVIKVAEQLAIDDNSMPYFLASHYEQHFSANRNRNSRSNRKSCNQNNSSDTTGINHQLADVNRGTVKRNFGDCPICMDSLTINTTASTLCGHIFCMSCIRSSLRVSKKCPICRKHVKSYHPLFLN